MGSQLRRLRAGSGIYRESFVAADILLVVTHSKSQTFLLESVNTDTTNILNVTNSDYMTN